MDPVHEYQLNLTRRQLLLGATKPLGAAALAMLIAPAACRTAGAADASGASTTGLAEVPHFAAKAKRVIYLFMCGGPSHIDTFDFKPAVRKLHGQELPDSVRQGQRITGMTSGQKSFPVVAPMFKFNRHGRHGTYVSEILPHTGGTDAYNRLAQFPEAGYDRKDKHGHRAPGYEQACKLLAGLQLG